MVSRVLSDSNTPAAANSTKNSPQIQEAVIDWMIDNALNQKAVTFSQEDFQNYSSISSSSKSKTSASSNSNSNSMMVEIIDICDSDDDDDQVNNSLKNQVSQVNQFDGTKNKTNFSNLIEKQNYLVLPVQQTTTVNQPKVFRKILPANLRGTETKPDLITKNDSTTSYSSSFSLNCSDENSQILSTLFATLSSRETSYSPSTSVKSNTTNESTTNFAVNKLTYANNKVPDKLSEPTSTTKSLAIQPTKPLLSPFQPLIERSQKLDHKMGNIMQKFSIKNFSAHDEQVKRKLENVTPGIKKLKSSPDSSLSSINLSPASNVNQPPSTKLNSKSSTNRTKSLSFFGSLAFQAREILTEVTKNVTSSSTSLHSEPKSSSSSINQPIVSIESSKSSITQKSSKLPITIASETNKLNQKLSDEQASQTLPTARTRSVSTALQVPQAKATTSQTRPASPATQAIPSSQAHQAKTTASQVRPVSPVIQAKPSSQAPNENSSTKTPRSTSHVKLPSPALPTTQAVQATQALPASQTPQAKSSSQIPQAEPTSHAFNGKPSTKTRPTPHVKLVSPALPPATQSVQAPQAKPSSQAPQAKSSSQTTKENPTKTRPASHVKRASPELPTTEVVQDSQTKSSSQAKSSQAPSAKSSQASHAKPSTKTKTRPVSPVIQAKSSSPSPQAGPTSQVPQTKPSTETLSTCDVKLESPSASCCSLVTDTDTDNNSESLYVRSKREREKLLSSAFQSVYAKSTTKRGSSFYNNLIV